MTIVDKLIQDLNADYRLGLSLQGEEDSNYFRVFKGNGGILTNGSYDDVCTYLMGFSDGLKRKEASRNVM